MRVIVLILLAVLAGGCWMQHSPLLNPATGPGTPYPCVGHPTGTYCEDETCCPDGTECKSNPDRCDADPLPVDTDWIQGRGPRRDDGGVK